jgi:glycogen(starch) synthase
VAELIPALVQRGTSIHLVTSVAKAEATPVATEEGVTVHRVFVPALNTQTDIYSQALKVNKVIEDYIQRTTELNTPFDVIHTHDWLTSFAAEAIQKARSCPMVVTIHATERGRSRGHLNSQLQQAIDHAEQNVVNEAQRVIVCSRHMSDEVQYFFRTPKAKINVIPNGVNIDNLENRFDEQELATFRSKYADPNEMIVFTISRLVYEKGVHLLVQAAPSVLSECPETRIIIAGHGPEAENLKRQAQNLGVADRVNFIGFISDKERNQFYKTAACAVFPSLYEPFGIVALEAMALGCPIVVSDVGGFAEMVTHAETGIKIYPDNVDSTAWGIVHALTHPNWVNQHAIRARQTVKEMFNWPRIAGLTIDAYQAVLKENTA